MKAPDWLRNSRLGPVYYGWWALAASSALLFMANGIFFRGFAVFYVPVQESLRLSNFQTSLVFSMSRGMGGVVGPLAGWLIDSFGYRRLVLLGVLLIAAGYFAFSRVDSYLWFALVYIGLIALGHNIGYQSALDAGLVQWFIRRRALVWSIYAAIGALGGLLLIPLINTVIVNVGWEWAAVGAAGAYLVVGVPLAATLKPSPESMGLLPDGDRPESLRATSNPSGAEQAGVPAPAARRDFTLPEALKSSAFWLLLVGIALFVTAEQGVGINIQPILISKNVSQETVGYLLALMLGIRVAVVIPIGWLADRWPKSLILVGCTALQALGALSLLWGSWESAPWGILMYLVLTGIGDRSHVICWVAVGDFFGRNRFATLKGLINFSFAWALVASPAFVGWWFDRTESYTVPIWISIVLFGLAALCFVMLRRPQGPPERRPARQ